MPRGVTWSKRMSIQGSVSNDGEWSRIKAAGRKFEYRINLFARDVELLNDFLDGGACFQDFQTRRRRASGCHETPMRRSIGPARFPRQGILTKGILTNRDS